MKFRIMNKLFIVIAFCFAPLVVVGESPDFSIEMKLVENGVDLAAPRMLVKEGADASISLSGENEVSVGFVVNSYNEGEAHVLAKVETSGAQISPELLVEKGQWASVSVGDLEFHVLVQDHAASK